MKAKRTSKGGQTGGQHNKSQVFPSSGPTQKAGTKNIEVAKMRKENSGYDLDARIMQRLLATLYIINGKPLLFGQGGGGDDPVQALLKAVGQLTEKVDQMSRKLEQMSEKVDTLEQASAPPPPTFPYRIAPDRKTDFVKLTKALTLDKMFVNDKGIAPKNKEMIKAFSQLMDDPTMAETYTSVLSRSVNGNEKAFLQVFEDLKQEMKTYRNKTIR